MAWCRRQQLFLTCPLVLCWYTLNWQGGPSPTFPSPSSVFPLSNRDLSLVVSFKEFVDGSYVVVYLSVVHPAIPEQKGFVRANLEPTGFIIRPSSNKKFRTAEVDCVLVNF